MSVFSSGPKMELAETSGMLTVRIDPQPQAWSALLVLAMDAAIAFAIYRY